MTGIATLSSKLAACARGRDRGVVAHDLEADHQRRLGQDRVDLAGHDARPRLQVREVDLGESGGRAGRHPAQVVADLGQPDRDRAQHAGELDERVPGALRLEVVAGLGERPGRSSRTAPRSPAAGKPAGVLMPVPTAVPPSGSSRTRGSTDSSRSPGVADGGGVPAELLAEHHRRRVHEVRAAGLHQAGELGGLRLQRGGEDARAPGPGPRPPRGWRPRGWRSGTCRCSTGSR